MQEISEQELRRIQKILIRLHVCMLLIVTYFTLKAYTAAEPIPKAFNIFMSLMFGAGVAWVHILARIKHSRKKAAHHE